MKIEGDTFSLIIRPDKRATNKGAVYCKVTACPIGILASAEKYNIIAIRPDKHLKNIVLVSFGTKVILFKLAIITSTASSPNFSAHFSEPL